MEISQLRYYVATARQMNFGRAAAELGISQPSLSRAIQSLEKSLGFSLFDRDTRRMALTPAGAAFLVEARAALTQFEAARNISRRVAAGEIGTLRIGWITTVYHHGIQLMIRRFRRQWPSVELDFEEVPSSAQPDALREGRIDLGFFNTSDMQLDGLSVHVIDRCNYIAAIPSEWPEARKKRLRLRDLAHCPFVFKSKDGPPPHHYNEKLAACLEAGFTPNIVQTAIDAGVMRSLVACEVGVALVPNTLMLPEADGVTYVPLVDTPEYLQIELAMAWIPRGMPPPLAALIESIKGGGDAPARARAGKAARK